MPSLRMMVNTAVCGVERDQLSRADWAKLRKEERRSGKRAAVPFLGEFPWSHLSSNVPSHAPWYWYPRAWLLSPTICIRRRSKSAG